MVSMISYPGSSRNAVEEPRGRDDIEKCPGSSNLCGEKSIQKYFEKGPSRNAVKEPFPHVRPLEALRKRLSTRSMRRFSLSAKCLHFKSVALVWLVCLANATMCQAMRADKDELPDPEEAALLDPQDIDEDPEERSGGSDTTSTAAQPGTPDQGPAAKKSGYYDLTALNLGTDSSLSSLPSLASERTATAPRVGKHQPPLPGITAVRKHSNTTQVSPVTNKKMFSFELEDAAKNDSETQLWLLLDPAEHHARFEEPVRTQFPRGHVGKRQYREAKRKYNQDVRNYEKSLRREQKIGTLTSREQHAADNKAKQKANQKKKKSQRTRRLLNAEEAQAML